MIIDTLKIVDTVRVIDVTNPDPIRVLDTLKFIDVTPSSDINTFTIINVILVILNLGIVLYFNIYAFRKRRREDRSYQMESSLYKDLIINNLKNLLSHTSEIENMLLEIIKSSVDGEEKIKFAQEKFTSVEHRQDTFNTEELEIIAAYNVNLAKEVGDATNEFYDSVSELWVKLMRNDPPDDKTLLKKFERIRRDYYKRIIKQVKFYQPKVEIDKKPTIFQK